MYGNFKDGQFFCEECFYNLYFWCNNCEKIFSIEDRCIADNGWYYCPDCFDEVNLLHDYDYKPEAIIFHNDNDENNNNLHVGIELEIQGKNHCSFIKKAKEKFDETIFYFKHDGSLDDTGVEIVSQPMSYNFIKHTDYWYDLFNLMFEYGMDDVDNAGLHFHLDKNYFSESEIAVIDYIVNNFSHSFYQCGGRIFNSNSRYCRTVYKNLEDWGKNTNKDNRYQAVNLTNQHTIELRFCESTYEFDVFKERVKLIYAIAQFAKQYTLKDIYNWNEYTFINHFNKIILDMFVY